MDFKVPPSPARTFEKSNGSRLPVLVHEVPASREYTIAEGGELLEQRLAQICQDESNKPRSHGNGNQ